MSDKDDLRENFFFAIGRCLHSWGFVELELANLYMILLGVTRDAYSHPARAAFETVISLEVRVAMITAFVSADPELASYKPHAISLAHKIMKLYKKRHEVAHFLVGKERLANNASRTQLMPFVTLSAFAAGRLKKLSIAQVNDRAEQFQQLGDRLRQHVQHVGSLRKLPTEYYARPGEIVFPALEPADLSQSEP